MISLESLDKSTDVEITRSVGENEVAERRVTLRVNVVLTYDTENKKDVRLVSNLIEAVRDIREYAPPMSATEDK
jgi:hypothetical protein